MNLFETAKDHLIIVAHAGITGEDIPNNTMAAFETALAKGVDMLELDVSMSADGVLIIFHPGMEEWHFGKQICLSDIPYEEISKLRYPNTTIGIPRFDEVLEQFKGKCYINVDKFWDHPMEIYHTIKRHNMLDQIVVKCDPSEEVFRFLEEAASDIAYLPIVWNTYRHHEELLRRNINYVGAEVIFTSENAQVASDEMIERMHRDGKLLWVNAFDLGRHKLTAGHSDEVSLSESPDQGWGWLSDRGFDMIQTNWAGKVIDYLKQNDKYYR